MTEKTQYGYNPAKWALKDEKDIMILETPFSTRDYLSIFALLIGIYLFFNFFITHNPLFGVSSILIFFVGLFSLLNDKSNRIMIDKKSQRVIIKSKQEEIPFSDINFVGIAFSTNGMPEFSDLYDYSWYIYLSLNTIRENPWIYQTSNELDVVKIAEKIGRLTEKEIKGRPTLTDKEIKEYRSW